MTMHPPGVASLLPPGDGRSARHPADRHLTGAQSVPDPVTEALHAAAVAAGEPMYEDPATGLWGMTEASLRARGWCCGNGCRHCPYGHENVPDGG